MCTIKKQTEIYQAMKQITDLHLQQLDFISKQINNLLASEQELVSLNNKLKELIK